MKAPKWWQVVLLVVVSLSAVWVPELQFRLHSEQIVLTAVETRTQRNIGSDNPLGPDVPYLVARVNGKEEKFAVKGADSEEDISRMFISGSSYTVVAAGTPWLPVCARLITKTIKTG